MSGVGFVLLFSVLISTICLATGWFLCLSKAIQFFHKLVLKVTKGYMEKNIFIMEMLQQSPNPGSMSRAFIRSLWTWCKLVCKAFKLLVAFANFYTGIFYLLQSLSLFAVGGGDSSL